MELHLEHSFILRWNVDDSGSRSETPGKFWNVVLEKDGKDQLDRSCEKWRNITSSQGAEEYPTWNSKRKANWLGHILRRNCLLQRVFKGKIKGGIKVTGRRGSRRRKLLVDLKEKRGYSHLKEEALDRTMWRTRFGRGFGPVLRLLNEWIWTKIVRTTRGSGVPRTAMFPSTAITCGNKQCRCIVGLTA